MASDDTIEFETITAEVTGRIGSLVLNRPSKLNPLGSKTLQEIALAARWFDRHPELVVVVVKGAGRAFSAGADLGAFIDGEEVNKRDAADCGRLMADALEHMEALTIAAVHGWCVGGGLVVVLACDLRLAASDVKFSIPEVDLGIPLAWGGIPRMVREIGPALTKELVLTCRPFGAQEGKAASFINEIVKPDQLEARADELAASIAAKARRTVVSTKRHVNSVTEQMVGTMRSWSDADGLVAALKDPECVEARSVCLAGRG